MVQGRAGARWTGLHWRRVAVVVGLGKRLRPALPRGLPGVAQSRLPASADGPFNYPFFALSC